MSNKLILAIAAFATNLEAFAAVSCADFIAHRPSQAGIDRVPKFVVQYSSRWAKIVREHKTDKTLGYTYAIVALRSGSKDIQGYLFKWKAGDVFDCYREKPNGRVGSVYTENHKAFTGFYRLRFQTERGRDCWDQTNIRLSDFENFLG